MYKSPLLTKYSVVENRNSITMEKPNKYYINSEIKVSWNHYIDTKHPWDHFTPRNSKIQSKHDQNNQENSSRETSYKILEQCSFKIAKVTWAMKSQGTRIYLRGAWRNMTAKYNVGVYGKEAWGDGGDLNKQWIFNNRSQQGFRSFGKCATLISGDIRGITCVPDRQELFIWFKTILKIKSCFLSSF